MGFVGWAIFEKTDDVKNVSFMLSSFHWNR